MSQNNQRPGPGAILGALLAFALITGCEENLAGSSQYDASEFAGEWIGQRFAMTSHDNPALVSDMVALGGVMLMTNQPDGSFSGSVTMPGYLIGTPDVESVTFPLSGSLELLSETMMTVHFAPSYPPFVVTRTSGFTLEDDRWIIFDEDSAYDFDRDGVEEPASFEFIMVRN